MGSHYDDKIVKGIEYIQETVCNVIRVVLAVFGITLFSLVLICVGLVMWLTYWTGL